MHTIRSAETEDDIHTVGELFREYEAWLEMDLCFQGFEDELAALPGKYAAPDGRLYIVEIDGVPTGCVAMRKLEDGICEMKRLYLRDSARGLGIGNKLIETLVAEARAIGYTKMRLDTYPAKMGKAVKLYESRGFRPIEPYYASPDAGLLFMELDLT